MDANAMPDAQKRAEQLAALVTDEKFMELLEEVERKPADQRGDALHEILTPDGLRRRGVSVPEGLKISTRWFVAPSESEPFTSNPVWPPKTTEEPKAASKPTLCVSVGTPGVPICVSVGETLGVTEAPEAVVE